MISTEHLRICQDFRVTYRTFMTGGTLFAEVIDLDTGQSYIRAEGPDHATAIAEVVSKVPTTPKPLTDSQARVAAMLSGASETIKAGDTRAAELEAALASVTKLLEDTAKRAVLAEKKLDEVMSADVAEPAASATASAQTSQPPADPAPESQSAPVRTRTPRTRAASVDNFDSQ